jgi:hypothetical protein
MKFKTLLKFMVTSLTIISSSAFASGKIIGINFSGPDDGHPNVVQIQIEGGFNEAGCNTTFAAIRVTDDRKHLISFALSAYATKEPVSIVLNKTDPYFLDRCTIKRISSVY